MKICSVDGCDREQSSKGYCHKHYKQLVYNTPEHKKMKNVNKGTIDSRLLEALVNVKNNVAVLQDKREEYPLNHNFGICGNVYFSLTYPMHQESYELMQGMRYLITQWPSAILDGEIQGYPVGGHDEYASEWGLGTIWQNPQRLALLDWLIKAVAEHLEQSK